MSTVQPSIEQHPDILALRADYERAAESLTAQATFGFTLLTAVYATLSPWIVGFDATTRLTVNDLIVGLTVAVLAMGFGSALDRTHGLAWMLPVFGVWFIVCPWILRDVSPTAGMIWSNVVTGAVITVLGLFATYFGMRARSHEAHGHAAQ
jgi:SPW repeat